MFHSYINEIYLTYANNPLSPQGLVLSTDALHDENNVAKQQDPNIATKRPSAWLVNKPAVEMWEDYLTKLGYDPVNTIATVKSTTFQDGSQTWTTTGTYMISDIEEHYQKWAETPSTPKLNKHLYCFRAGVTMNYKIGITHNLDRRLSVLQVANPLKLSVAYVSPLLSNSDVVEAAAHSLIANRYRRLEGEWFFVPVTGKSSALVDLLTEVVERGGGGSLK